MSDTLIEPNKIVKLTQEQELSLLSRIIKDFDKFDDARAEQLEDIRSIRDAIYHNNKPKNNWGSKFELPEIWELAQTLKAHLMENLYSNPEAMFDVSGADVQSQVYANLQKSMLVSYFERMKISDCIEKVVDSVVESGEATLFIGWERVAKILRRPVTLEELFLEPDMPSFVYEEKPIFEGPKVKFVNPEDFVFDVDMASDIEKAAKMYRSYLTLEDLRSDRLNNLLTAEKIALLSKLVDKKPKTGAYVSFSGDTNKIDKQKGVKGSQLEVIEYWGDVKLNNGTLLKNYLVVIVGRSHIVRFEPNPFINSPFIHASVLKNPKTSRGISPLKVAIGVSSLSSEILNKQLDALSLMVNPPYLAPKGCFNGEQIVSPGKIIEYDSALMPNQPIPLRFDNALHGWDFIKFFKTEIESATGIYKTMSGNLASSSRTATEINYSVGGQAARLNMLIESLNRKLIIPMVERTAELIANFKIGVESIAICDCGRTMFLDVDDNCRKANYLYRYGDRKAMLERKYKFKELFDVISAFAKIPGMPINWIECFKFALEQYGVENATNFLNS